MTALGGGLWASGKIPGKGDQPYRPAVRVASKMTDGMLRFRLCELGPDHCPSCESPCEYGKETVRRALAKKKKGMKT